MMVLGNKGFSQLLDDDRGCIILIICVSGTIKVGPLWTIFQYPQKHCCDIYVLVAMRTHTTALSRTRILTRCDARSLA